MFLFARFRKIWSRKSSSGSNGLCWFRPENIVMLSVLGTPLFPADNPWNQRIDQAPVAANSSTIMSNIGNGSLHPDFGQDYHNGDSLYGIPYNIVHGNSTPAVQVVIDAYPDESDLVERSDSRQRRARRRSAERPDRRRRQSRRLALDRLGRGQQRRLTNSIGRRGPAKTRTANGTPTARPSGT